VKPLGSSTYQAQTAEAVAGRPQANSAREFREKPATEGVPGSRLDPPVRHLPRITIT